MSIESKIGSVDDRTTRASRHPDGKDGILGSIVTLSLGMVESSVRTVANVGRTLTGESEKLSESVISLHEQGSQSLLRTARKLNESMFGLATDAVDRLEKAVLVGLSHGQKTTDRVAELAAQASSAALGARGIGDTARSDTARA